MMDQEIDLIYERGHPHALPTSHRMLTLTLWDAVDGEEIVWKESHNQ